MNVAFGGRRAYCHVRRFFGGIFSFSTRLASTKDIRLEMEGMVPANLVFDPDRVNQVRVESPRAGGRWGGRGGVERPSQTKEPPDCCPIL